MRIEPWTNRVERARWHGDPPGRPVILARRGAGHTVDVWASWNGATEIPAWRVLAGPTPGQLRPVGGPFGFADLETHMRVRTREPYLAVRATSRSRRVRGRSRAVRLG